ncbi:MAG TPA: DNA polymerase III subunit gamma/tau [Spirochaetota bacterium]|jgi:DNA polymerase-3 subunit gamma/tau|nr:DNA polymerase III subunit gamma/tau [Spirochaetota bacterium]OQA98900.1 MAG: DNA polymerase III subunit tau [Spirochaetes bacterium ADurb.Bin218]HON15441.1 DNA polymerase III subunit gamma/tau [Spirochaetota bacterium]HOV08599.1 DNA polymerase III subunit gamma/tau [Spirochaetota bacterium]HPX91942.1 DNA polymerase III subunit gamma/tau [Spirochaetota bacterium]
MMAYQVIARKWRPQDFNEVVFQQHVTKTIRNSIKQGRISHAYLFSGPRGVGKTTMARILAKALNCIHGPTADPCGVCENCLEIKQGNSFDVIEIDGASNNGVDNIRELRENVNFAPVKSRYKIYIIDEVHMVTTAAFNALLKTLEEPPPHIVFIFATTEIHKLPETILSRCQKFFFKKIPSEVVVDHLKHIVEREGYGISEKALYQIARIADGSMRDAQSLLEQVISFSGVSGNELEISHEDALTILGIVPLESYMRLFSLIAAKDRLSIIEEIDRIISSGIDVARYSSGLIDAIRYLRLIKSGIEASNLIDLSTEEIKGLRASGEAISDEELSKIFSIAIDLSKNLRFSSNDRVYLEMALLDMVSVIDTPSLAEILQKIEKINFGKLPSGEGAATPKNTKTLSIVDSWNEMLSELEAKKNKFFVILRPAKILAENENLFLSYPDDLDDRNYLESLTDELKSYIEKTLSKKTGKSIKIVIDSKKSENKVKVEDYLDDSESMDDDNSPIPDSIMERNPELDDYKVESQAVKKIQNAFYGQIIDNKGESKC